MDYNHFVSGSIAGIIASIIGHPLDTIKTRLQTGHSFSAYKNLLKSPYKGFAGHLGVQIMSNGILFGTYDNVYRLLGGKNSPSTCENTFPYINYARYMAAISAGAIESLFYTPLEYIKICKQTNVNISKSIFTGFAPTLMRESLGNCIYFGTYYTCRDHNISPAIAGGIAGATYWLGIYPIDTYKSLRQSGKNITVDIPKDYLHYYRGINVCLVRAIPVNAITFWTFEKINNYLQ